LLLLGSRRKGKEVAGGVLASSSRMVPISDEDPIDVGGGGIMLWMVRMEMMV
jgi:hypothetical protein